MARDGWSLLGVATSFDPDCRFVTSPVLSPWALAGIRLTLAFYTLGTLLAILIREATFTHDAASFFSYFTELTYIGICSYFFASGLQTLLFARRSSSSTYPLQRWPRVLQFLHSLLWTTITTFPFIVTPVFWALLAKPSTLSTTFGAWENISIHAFNSVFALFEIFFSNVGTQPWLHTPFLVLILAGYLGVAYITHATQGIYPYPFLNPQKEHAKLAAYIVGIPIATIIIFAIVRSICWIKIRLLGSREPQRDSILEKMRWSEP